MKKMKPAQRKAGHQARSHDGIRDVARRGWTSGRVGAGRGLRQGWLGTAILLQVDFRLANASRAVLV